MYLLCIGPAGVCKQAGTQRKAVVVRAAVASAPQQPAASTSFLQRAHGPIIMNGQVLHSITQERLDVVRSLEDGHLQTQVRCLLRHGLLKRVLRRMDSRCWSC